MDANAFSKEFIARKFALGQLLDIEIQDVGKTRFQSPLLGMREGKYLVTDPPSLTKHGNLREKLVEDQELIVRTICEKTTGECLGFKSHIMMRLNVPDQLLFITFPPHVVVHELRQEKRMLVFLEAQITCANGDNIAGTVIDLSSCGCRLELENNERLQFKREDHLTIEFKHPEDGRRLKHKALVRSVRNVGNLLSVGMSFQK